MGGHRTRLRAAAAACDVAAAGRIHWHRGLHHGIHHGAVADRTRHRGNVAGSLPRAAGHACHAVASDNDRGYSSRRVEDCGGGSPRDSRGCNLAAAVRGDRSSSRHEEVRGRAGVNEIGRDIRLHTKASRLVPKCCQSPRFHIALGCTDIRNTIDRSSLELGLVEFLHSGTEILGGFVFDEACSVSIALRPSNIKTTYPRPSRSRLTSE